MFTWTMRDDPLPFKLRNGYTYSGPISKKAKTGLSLSQSHAAGGGGAEEQKGGDDEEEEEEFDEEEPEDIETVRDQVSQAD